MQAHRTIPLDDLEHRRARKDWPCEGDGSSAKRHAPGCPGVVRRGKPYVEYTGETAAYQSGSRHSLQCAEAFLDWPPMGPRAQHMERLARDEAGALREN